MGTTSYDKMGRSAGDAAPALGRKDVTASPHEDDEASRPAQLEKKTQRASPAKEPTDPRPPWCSSLHEY